MAAAKIGRSTGFGSSGPLSRTQGILIETMQLVEPRKSVPVPNHLLETKVYSKLAQNSVVQARPAVLHFGGFEIGKTHKHALELANVSTEVQRMHIIPPQTKYFDIKYTKRDRLVPGLTLECTVEFTPDEWRYYYDCIRIHTKDEEHIVIPIHAYPVMSTEDFPAHIDFPAVPIGHRKSRMIPLRCSVPIDFEYQLVYLQPHPAFTVHPMSGVIPANGEVAVDVTFAPSEFSTAHMKLQLMISQFNAKPLICTVTGTSAPGLTKELTEMVSVYPESSNLDPRSITPIGRYREKKKLRKSAASKNSEKKPEELEMNGIRFPVNLDTPYAVAQVLNQEVGKLRIKDIREAVLAKKGDGVQSTRQMKEAVFEMAVRQDVYEERQNQLRWQVKVGDKNMTPQAKQSIEDKRAQAWQEYKHNRGDPVPEKEFNRACTSCSMRRTTRDISQLGEQGVKFDPYTNDMWAVRHTALRKLQQAARKIIIRRRASKKVQALREMVENWGNRSTANSRLRSVLSCARDGIDPEEEDFPISTNRITSVSFPLYAPPNVKDDMAVDALGSVPFLPTEVIVQKKTPFFDLKVPQQYDLMGYNPHSVHDAATTFVPKNLVRPLRSGAEDEMIMLPPPPMNVLEEELVNEGDMKVEEVSQTPTPSSELDTSLRPPTLLFEPINYPPLHIFNPAPGLQVFQPPLPYAETDPDFHLCPLPRYTSSDINNPHMSTQRRYLDREDVVRGVMAWKKFPSQGLTSLANTPTITNVWVPRWSDAFSQDILPDGVPPQVAGLSEQDKESITQEEGEEEEDAAELALTPEMITAQFSLIDSSTPAEDKTKKDDTFPYGYKMPSTNIPVSETGPVPRERREAELEYFLKKKYNRLGSRFQYRVNTLNQHKTNPDLILK